MKKVSWGILAPFMFYFFNGLVFTSHGDEVILFEAGIYLYGLFQIKKWSTFLWMFFFPIATVIFNSVALKQLSFGIIILELIVYFIGIYQMKKGNPF